MRKVRKAELPKVRKAKRRAERFSKSARTNMPSFTYDDSRAKIRQPPWDYEQLVELGKINWSLRMIYRAIKQEVLGPRWIIEPKFTKKCEKCGKEYDKVVQRCSVPACLGNVRDPSEDERKRLKAIYDKPNSEYGWAQIFATSIFYDQICGGYWWSITYHNVPGQDGSIKKMPAEIYVEDPRYMRFVADGKGKLGGMEMFCPTCLSDDTVFKPTTLPPDGKCPKCQTNLEDVAYVQEIEGKITARFAKDEIVFGSTDQVLPELYPCPKPVSLWKGLLTMQNMDDYNWEVYREGGVAALINFPGHKSKEELRALRAQVDDESKKQLRIDPVTGRSLGSKKLRTMFFSNEEKIDFIQLAMDLDKMQSLEFYKFYREAVGSVYGVTPIFVSVIESGKTGNNPRMQIDVQNSTTREGQANLETTVNDFLLPKFDIQDWRLAFEQPDPRDELRNQRVELLRAQTAVTWLTAGFNVTMDDQGDLQISGSGMMPQQPQPGAPKPGMETQPPLPEENLPEEVEEEAYRKENLALGIWKMPVPIPSKAGGKRRQTSLLRPQIPSDRQLYVEPFAGGATLFWALPNPGKAVLNDISPRFTKVWQWIKEASPKQIEAMKARKWDAESKEVWLDVIENYEPKTLDDEVWKTLYVVRHSFMRQGTREHWRGEIRITDPLSRNSAPNWLNRVEQYKQHLQQTTIEQRDWKECVKAHDDPETFFYIDPPYEEKFVDDLVAVLPKLKGRWLLSFGWNDKLVQALEKAGAATRKLVVFNLIGKPGGETRTQRQELLAANYPISVEDGTVIKGEEWDGELFEKESRPETQVREHEDDVVDKLQTIVDAAKGGRMDEALALTTGYAVIEQKIEEISNIAKAKAWRVMHKKNPQMTLEEVTLSVEMTDRLKRQAADWKQDFKQILEDALK